MIKNTNQQNLKQINFTVNSVYDIHVKKALAKFFLAYFSCYNSYIYTGKPFSIFPSIFCTHQTKCGLSCCVSYELFSMPAVSWL